MKYYSWAAALAAVVLAPSASFAVPTPLRLWEIPANRFVVDNTGAQILQLGLLDSFGIFRITSTSPVPSTVTVPPSGLNRTLITIDAWYAYTRLSDEAVANFDAEPVGGETIIIGARDHIPIAAKPDGKFDLGDLENISARGVITPGGEPLIGGFIIHRQSRRVLIRCVGPTLSQFGVTQPLADPYLLVYTQGSGTPFLFNDDWGQRFDAAEIKQVSAQITGFQLPDGSKDAAYLFEFDPGAYTVHLTTTGTTGGTALLEIYIVP